MTDQTIDDSIGTEQIQTETKTYTQEEVNNMMARVKGSIAKKYEKQYADLGDPEELRSLKSEAEKRRTEEQLKRGEFEKTLQELASKKDAEIAMKDAVIKDFKLNTPLLETAAKFRAVKPEQVRDLLRNNVRLDETGEPVVVDTQGKVKYSDKGTPITVQDLVQSFLNENPHFVQPTPTTTVTKSSHTANQSKIDVSKLNMRDPEHREIYKQYRKDNGLA